MHLDAIEAGGTANGSAGQSPTGNVLANDTDVDAGDTLSVTLAGPGSLTSSNDCPTRLVACDSSASKR